MTNTKFKHQLVIEWTEPDYTREEAMAKFGSVTENFDEIRGKLLSGDAKVLEEIRAEQQEHIRKSITHYFFPDDDLTIDKFEYNFTIE